MQRRNRSCGIANHLSLKQQSTDVFRVKADSLTHCCDCLQLFAAPIAQTADIHPEIGICGRNLQSPIKGAPGGGKISVFHLQPTKHAIAVSPLIWRKLPRFQPVPRLGQISLKHLCFTHLRGDQISVRAALHSQAQCHFGGDTITARQCDLSLFQRRRHVTFAKTVRDREKAQDNSASSGNTLPCQPDVRRANHTV